MSWRSLGGYLGRLRAPKEGSRTPKLTRQRTTCVEFLWEGLR